MHCPGGGLSDSWRSWRVPLHQLRHLLDLAMSSSSADLYPFCLLPAHLCMGLWAHQPSPDLRIVLTLKSSEYRPHKAFSSLPAYTMSFYRHTANARSQLTLQPRQQGQELREGGSPAEAHVSSSYQLKQIHWTQESSMGIERKEEGIAGMGGWNTMGGRIAGHFKT